MNLKDRELTRPDIERLLMSVQPGSEDQTTLLQGLEVIAEIEEALRQVCDTPEEAQEAGISIRLQKVAYEVEWTAGQAGEGRSVTGPAGASPDPYRSARAPAA